MFLSMLIVEIVLLVPIFFELVPFGILLFRALARIGGTVTP